MEDDKVESGYEVENTQTLPLLPAVTAKYTYYALKNMYGQVSFTQKTDNVRTGLTLNPPVGYTIQIAFLREGKENVEEALREDAITYEEFMAQWQKMNILLKLSRENYTSEGF